MSKVYRCRPHFEDSSLILRCRIQKADESGDAAVQATFSSIVISFYDLKNPRNKIVVDRTLTINDVVFDTLQTPDTWTLDTLGYNVKIVLNATDFPKGDREVRVDAKFTYASPSGFVAHACWDVPTIDLLRS